jgi:hypothetical protein
MKQTDRILRYMDDFGSISPVEALEQLSIMRLASRIHDLRQRGIRINGRTEFTVNRYGEKVHYTRYYRGD